MEIENLSYWKTKATTLENENKQLKKSLDLACESAIVHAFNYHDGDYSDWLNWIAKRNKIIEN